MTCQRCHHPEAIERGNLVLCYACIDQLEGPRYEPREPSDREAYAAENSVPMV